MTTIFTTDIPEGVHVYTETMKASNGEFGYLLYYSTLETGPVEIAIFTGDADQRGAEGLALRDQIMNGTPATEETVAQWLATIRARNEELDQEKAEIERDGGLIPHMLKRGLIRDSAPLEDDLDKFLQEDHDR